MSASILIVEDEPGIQELLKFNLGHHGHEVIVASDAEEASARMRDSLPKLPIEELEAIDRALAVLAEIAKVETDLVLGGSEEI